MTQTSKPDSPSVSGGQTSTRGDHASLRRQMLRQAVEHNVSIKEGRVDRRPPPTPAAARSWRWLLWATPLLAAALSLPFLLPNAFAGRADLEEELAETSEPLLADPADVVELPKPRLDANRPIFDLPTTPIDPDVFPLEVRTIVIDPGHGGEDSGTTADGMLEKELTLDIATRLAEDLAADGFVVHLTRSDDSFVSLRERASMANEKGADLFVSIHINWIVDRGVRGLETYYLGATDDPYLNALARRENRASGYSLSDMRELLESIYTDVRRGESAQLASSVQRSLLSSLRRDNPHLENRGVKTAPFVVLVATEMPAILAEVSCLSNRDEARLLGRPFYREHIARALSRGIRRYADDVKQIEEKGS